MANDAMETSTSAASTNVSFRESGFATPPSTARKIRFPAFSNRQDPAAA